jgi:RES domain-containing protein
VTPLPALLGGKDLVAWRLDRDIYAATWDRGEGAYRVGGRWNSRGIRAVYCSFDPATALVEVAVHKGFDTLDAVAHTLTCVEILEPGSVYVVDPSTIPNPSWLVPGIPGDAQQKFGDTLLARHRFVAIPSAVSRNSWNLLFVADLAKGAYRLKRQERFALDTRLNPPK